MKTTSGKIPEEILTAVNALLAPYGAKFNPNSTEPTGRGYTDYEGAMKYTGLSRISIYRAARSGELRSFRPTGERKGHCIIRFSYDDLDAYMTR